MKTLEPIETLMPVDERCATNRLSCGPATHVINFELPFKQGDKSYEGEEFFCKFHYDLLVEVMKLMETGDEQTIDAFLEDLGTRNRQD